MSRDEKWLIALGVVLTNWMLVLIEWMLGDIAQSLAILAGRNF